MSKFSQRIRIVPSGYDDGWVLEIDGEVQSHVDLHDPRLIRFEYLRRIGNVLDSCWPEGKPIRLLHLGAGALTLVRYGQATRPGSHQTVIELNPDLVRQVTSQLPLPKGTDLTVITGDARSQLSKLEHAYFDAIVVDIFTGKDSAAHLSDADFYCETLQHLTSQGVVLVNIGDDDGLAFFDQQSHILDGAAVSAGLSGVWTLADASTLEQRLAGNAVLAAGPGLPTDDADVVALRRQLEAAGPYPARVLAPGDPV